MGTNANSTGLIGKRLWAQERRSVMYVAISLLGIMVVVARQLVSVLYYSATSDFSGRMVMNLDSLLGLLFLAGAVYGGWRAYQGLVPAFGQDFLLPSWTVKWTERMGSFFDEQTFRDESEAQDYANRHPGSEIVFNGPWITAYLGCLICRALIGAMFWMALEIMLQVPHLWAAYRQGGGTGGPARWSEGSEIPVIGMGAAATIVVLLALSVPVGIARSSLIPKVPAADLARYRSVMQPDKVYEGAFADQEPHERVLLTLKEDPDHRSGSQSETWSLLAELKSLDHPERSRTFHVGVKPRFPERMDFSGHYQSKPGTAKATGHDLAFSPHDYCYLVGRITDEGAIELMPPKSTAPWIRLTAAKSSP
jgi:hypothetical protein